MNEEQDKLLLETVVNGIPYSFVKEMLVKPLEDVIVKKEVITPTPTGEVDEEGIAITENVSEITEEPSNFKQGIILKEACGYKWIDGQGNPLAEEFIPRIGDTIVYGRRSSVPFDLFKDSELVNPYNVVGFIKK